MNAKKCQSVNATPPTRWFNPCHALRPAGRHIFARLRRHENEMTTRQRVPTAIILVGSAFAAIGIALACGAIFVLRYRSGAFTTLMVLVTFGWAILAMVGSMLLTRGHGRGRGRHHGHHLPAFDIPVRRRARPCGADRLSLCGRPRHAGRCVRQSWHRILHGKLGKAGASAARRGVIRSSALRTRLQPRTSIASNRRFG